VMSAPVGRVSGMHAARAMKLESAGDEQTPLLPSDGGAEKDRSWGCGWAMVCGPAMVSSLADTDVGCLLVALESGAQHGYLLLPLQVLLVPVLFLAQELTVRLGVYQRKGLTAMLRDKYGPTFAWCVVAVLLAYCVSITVSELSGIAGVAELWGAPQPAALAIAAGVLLGAGLGLAYRSLEKFAIALGMFEVVFIVTMALEKHDPEVVAREVSLRALESRADVNTAMMLMVANIGAVIMPFMLFFQQSAVVTRQLKPGADEHAERVDTMVGSSLTQLIMIGALMTTAASRGTFRESDAGGLRSITSVAVALSTSWGPTTAKVLVSLAFLGAALCATFVTTLCAAWAVNDALGLPMVRGDERVALSEAPHFYATYAAVVALGIAFLCLGIPIVQLNVGIEFLGACVSPPLLYFLYDFATSTDMPEEGRVAGWHKIACLLTFLLVSGATIAGVVFSLT